MKLIHVLLAVIIIEGAALGVSESTFSVLVQTDTNNGSESTETNITERPIFEETTGNMTTKKDFPHGVEKPKHQPFTLKAGYFTVPIILVVGLFGNIMSIVVMTRKEFRKMTMRIVIIALAFSDTLLIIMQPNNKPYVRRLLTTDLRSYGVISCKIFYWFFRTAKMTSSWLIVLLTCERLIAVWFPFKAKIINSKHNVKLAVALVYACIGSFNAVWASISDILVSGDCTPNSALPHLVKVAKGIVGAGTMIYAILPSASVLTMNVMIIARSTAERRRRVNLTSECNSKQKGQQSRLTAMLLGVSISFVVLVTPNAILQSMSTFSGYNHFVSKDPPLVIAHEVIQTLELLNYSVNFYLYVLCSRLFREAAVRLITCRQCGRLVDGKRRQMSSSTQVSELKEFPSTVDFNLDDPSQVRVEQVDVVPTSF